MTYSNYGGIKYEIEKLFRENVKIDLDKIYIYIGTKDIFTYKVNINIESFKTKHVKVDFWYDIKKDELFLYKIVNKKYININNVTKLIHGLLKEDYNI